MLKKRKTGLKIFLTVIAVILICLIGLQIGISPLAKKIVSQKVSPLFGDKLKIGSIGISIFHGSLIIKDIKLLQPPGFSKENFLETKAIRVRIALLPLLKKQLVIYGITILQPTVNLVQLKNGKINTTYFLSKIKKSSPKSNKSTSKSISQKPSFNLHLNRLVIRKGKVAFYSYRMSSRQPTFLLTNLNLSLKDVNIPNEKNIPSPFSLNGIIASPHPATIESKGKGIFLGEAISFQAKTRIKKIAINDFNYLCPKSAMVVKEGNAFVNSDAKCKNNYLNSEQHVEIKKLKIASKKGGLFGKTVLGLPADAFVKILQDEKGCLNFDFEVTGNLDNLKVNAKVAIGKAIAKSINDKIGARIIEVGKRLGTTAVKEIKGKIKETGEEITTKTEESIKEIFDKFGK